jgi:hypothetical protein
MMTSDKLFPVNSRLTLFSASQEFPIRAADRLSSDNSAEKTASALPVFHFYPMIKSS